MHNIITANIIKIIPKKFESLNGSFAKSFT